MYLNFIICNAFEQLTFFIFFKTFEYQLGIIKKNSVDKFISKKNKLLLV